MRFGILFCVLAVPVLTAADRYIYREPAPVVEKRGLQSVLPPCKHAGGYKFDGASSALIQSQSQARIVNQKTQHTAEHNLEAAASGYSSQSQALTSSNLISGDAASKGAAFQGNTNTFSAGQGYVQNGISNSLPKPPVNYIPVQQGPPALAAQSQSHSISSGQTHGHNYNHAAASQNIEHHHVHIQQPHVPAAFPVPPRPVSAGPVPSVSVISSSSQHAAAHGGQYASQHFGGQLPAHFGSHLSSANFGGQHSASNFAGQQSASNFGGHHTGSNFGGHHSAQNFGGQQAASNFGSQHTGLNHGGHQYASNFGSQAASSDFASQLASSNFAGQHTADFASFSSSSLGANGLNGQLGHVIRETVANAPLDPSADKHIYVHIPPEDIEGDNQATAIAPQYAVPPKKHYKIVFIKAPTHATPNYGQLAAAAAPKVEEKTLIYVLVKKPEQPSVEELQQLQQTSYKTSKPEVYFIKYKTQKEGDVTQNTAYAPNGSVLAPDQIDITTSSPNEDIDIRSGGIVTEGPKHELYGVPLQ